MKHFIFMSLIFSSLYLSSAKAEIVQTPNDALIILKTLAINKGYKVKDVKDIRGITYYDGSFMWLIYNKDDTFLRFLMKIPGLSFDRKLMVSVNEFNTHAISAKAYFNSGTLYLSMDRFMTNGVEKKQIENDFQLISEHVMGLRYYLRDALE